MQDLEAVPDRSIPSPPPSEEALRSLEGAPVRRSRGRPPKITREEVVAASVDLADLTLKSVADHLGVTTQALYRYIRDREELIGMVAERMAEKFPVPPDTGEDWCAWAYKFASVLHDLNSAVPGLADHAMSAPPASVKTMKRYEISVSIAIRSGFDPAAAVWATLAVADFVHGWVAREQRREAGARDSGRPTYEASQAIALSHINELPGIAAGLPLTKDRPSRERFDYTLRALLAGLDKQRQVLPFAD